MRVIKIRVYKGLKLLFNEQGQVENKNQTVTLLDGEEWLNYISFIKVQGYCKVDLESVIETEGNKPVTGDYLKMIVNQLEEACRADKQNPMDKGVRLDIKIKDEEKKEGSTIDADAEKELKTAIREKLKLADVKFSPASTLEMLQKKAKENNIEI